MVELESEAMLLGIWKNYEELEESVGLEELGAIVSAARDRENRHNKFMAALKGIDLGEDDKKERFEEIERRAQAKIEGRTVEDLEFEDLKIDVVTE